MFPRKTFFKITLCVCMLFCHGMILGTIPAKANVRGADANVQATAISVKEANLLRINQDVVTVDVRTARSWWRSSKKILGAERGDPAHVKEWEPNYTSGQKLILYCS
jgi:hypothetical protein